MVHDGTSERFCYPAGQMLPQPSSTEVTHVCKSCPQKRRFSGLQDPCFQNNFGLHTTVPPRLPSWELWARATQGTQSATRLPCLAEDDDAWQSACEELLEVVRASRIWLRAKWRLRAIGAMWFSALACLIAVQWGTWTGRTRLMLVCASIVLPLVSEVLRRHWPQSNDWSDTPLRRGTDSGEQMNDTMTSSPAVPSENVHVRGASTELMQSLTSLACVPLRGAPPPPASALRWRPAGWASRDGDGQASIPGFQK